MKKAILWFSIFLTVFTGSGCVAAPAVPAELESVMGTAMPEDANLLVDPLDLGDVDLQTAITQLEASERKLVEQYPAPEVIPLSESQKVSLDLEDLDFTFVDFGNLDSFSAESAGNAILMPAAALTPQQTMPIFQSIASLSRDGTIVDGLRVGMNYVTVRTYHFMGHAADIGVPFTAVSQMGQMMHSIVNTGAIYFRPATNNIQAQYMFVASSYIGGNEHKIALFLAESGAPITTFDTSLAYNKYKATEAARYLRVQQAKGYIPISWDQLPEGIKQSWGTKSPSIWRYLWWSAAYQAEMYARYAALQAGATATSWVQFVARGPMDIFGIFVLPDVNSPLPLVYKEHPG